MQLFVTWIHNHCSNRNSHHEHRHFDPGKKKSIFLQNFWTKRQHCCYISGRRRRRKKKGFWSKVMVNVLLKVVSQQQCCSYAVVLTWDQAPLPAARPSPPAGRPLLLRHHSTRRFGGKHSYIIVCRPHLASPVWGQSKGGGGSEVGG